MPKLLEVSFGPVQDFIASARRTADLWAGSHLLSESARRAGQAILKSGGILIYPDPRRIEEREAGQSNVSNVLLAELPEHCAPAEVAERAIAEARSYLAGQGEEALHEFPQLRQPLFRFQLQDALEAYAAWAEYPDDSSYQQAYKALKTTFSLRKNTRDFRAATWPEATDPKDRHLPKNSLDGLRETVLPELDTDRLRRGKWRKLHLSPGEQLDALAVLKRWVGNTHEAKFAALTRIAAHDWIQGISTPELESLRGAYEPLVSLGVASRCPSNGGRYDTFPYDAALLFPERLQVAYNEARDGDDPEGVRNALDALERALKPLWKRYGKPLPYAAVLMADGDRMGKFVAAAQNSEHHRRLTVAIAGFADRAIEILRSGGGQAIYAGGEDVLGFLPLSSVLQVPRRLASAFSEAIAPLSRDLQEIGRVDQPPTLRVGVAIAHVQQPLGYIRHLADRAEKLAKGLAGSDQQGNALGLRLHVRGGHVLSWRLPFAAYGTADFDALSHWIDRFDSGSLATGMGYEIRALGDRIHLQRLPAEISAPEFSRLLAQARERGGQRDVSMDLQKALQRRLSELQRVHPESGGALRRLGEELILSRWLSARRQGDILGGERP
ncbi:type III-B CRISPR-associated protein Cas10/Cmr2 [Acidithiobacillus caldus]